MTAANERPDAANERPDAANERPDFVCAYCGISFPWRRDRKYKPPKRRFCSQACREAGTYMGKIEVECYGCKRLFTISASRYAWRAARGSGVYCTRACYMLTGYRKSARTLSA